MTRYLPAVCLALLSACSPVYVYKSAAGHTKLLWHRKDIGKAIADARTPPELRDKLQLVSDVREYAFTHIHLKRRRAYSTYSVIDRPFVTYLVSGSRKTRFEPYYWHFPLIGAFPYKGHFDKKDAESEKDWLERRGYDAYISGVAAYSTPLLLSDPAPSPVLDYPAGELAGLIIHELTHGTIFFKNQTAFDEALATFVGNQGAEEFLAARFGEGSKELAEFRRSLQSQTAFSNAIDELYLKLDALYRSGASEEQKLKDRAALFERGRSRLEELGFKMKTMNNAVILAHRLYHEDSGLFKMTYERSGRDWKKTMEIFRGLNRKSPLTDLRRKLSP